MSSSQVITIKELRVLSGLSRGAALPLDSPLYIGSSPECDVLLLDPGVASRHLMLERHENGDVALLDLTDPSASTILQPEEQLFRVGEVELIWCASDKPWFTEATVSVEKDSTSDSKVAAPVELNAWLSQRRVLWLATMAALVMLLGFVNLITKPKIERTPSTLARNLNSRDRPLVTSPQESQAVIEEKLHARSFSQLAVISRDNALVITGNIRADQQQELETLIQSWRKENPLTRIVLELKESKGPSLPFEFVAMVGGAVPSVLTSSGRFLFPGSESEGYRLISMNGACLTLEHIESHQRLKQCLDHSSPQR